MLFTFQWHGNNTVFSKVLKTDCSAWKTRHYWAEVDVLELRRYKKTSENRKWQHAYVAIVFFALALLLISFHTTRRVILKSLFTVPWEHTYVGYFLMAVHIRWTILLRQAPGPLYCNYIILLYVISATKEDFFKSGQTWETLLNNQRNKSCTEFQWMPQRKDEPCIPAEMEEAVIPSRQFSEPLQPASTCWKSSNLTIPGEKDCMKDPQMSPFPNETMQLKRQNAVVLLLCW